MILATAVSETVNEEGLDFLPLQVDFREKAYAAGVVPKNFLRREGR